MSLEGNFGGKLHEAAQNVDTYVWTTEECLGSQNSSHSLTTLHSERSSDLDFFTSVTKQR